LNSTNGSFTPPSPSSPFPPLPPPQLSDSDFNTWHKEYADACASVANRTEEIQRVAEKIEKDLVVVGVTAIEDKLQVRIG